MHELIQYMTLRTVGDEADHCLPEIETWIRTHLPGGYTWPGNYRELEQCVRNVVIRRSYQPLATTARTQENNLFDIFRSGEASAEEVLSRYAAHVYKITGSFEKAAQKLHLDRRTVKRLVTRSLADR